MIDINNKQEEDRHIIQVNGDVDASSSIHLDEAIANALEKHTKILVDLTDLNYISSAGLGVFMSYLQEIEEKEAKMVLYGLSEKVKSTFQILGLDQLLMISESKEQAEGVVNEI